ncbi:pitrilysin family protein [Lentibacillus sp. N15]|uniref:EF-P 5-aminopentanol modification-associated protein YfmF n=1 Tax=Lentibacillus songyuanensis TaxID=3136161 RepID=UPI0031BB8728
MNELKESVFQEHGLQIHVIPNQKYKTIAFAAKFKAPLDKATVTKRALLGYVLKQGTKAYPTRGKLQEQLDQLYGAVLSIDSMKKGNHHIITVRLEVANDKFIADEAGVMEGALDLLHDVIFNPNATGGSFSQPIVDREKETLQQKIHALVDDKMSYANTRLIDEMCPDEVYRLHVHGYEEDLASITPENLYRYYQHMLTNDQLDIYVSGDVDSDQIKEKLVTRMKQEDKRQLDIVSGSADKMKQLDQVNTVIEQQNVQQAKLHLGYRTNITYHDEDYFALQVFNGIFGGFPNSKLFINVREKRSLAYYASSRIESHKGLLFVFSGIAPKDYEQAREIIEQQMEAMKKGEFDNKQMEETKGLIVNQLLETMDNQQGIIELLYQQVVGNRNLTPDQLIEGIKQVTKEEVIKTAQKMELDTVYLLTTNGGDFDE